MPVDGAQKFLSLISLQERSENRSMISTNIVALEQEKDDSFLAAK